MRLHNLGNRVKMGYTTFGCTWEKGACKEGTLYELKNADGEVSPPPESADGEVSPPPGSADGEVSPPPKSADRVPMQTKVTAWWPDGSIKWTSHTADAGLLGDNIEVNPVVSPPPKSTDGVVCPPPVSADGGEKQGTQQCAASNNISIVKNESGMRIKGGCLSLDIPDLNSAASGLLFENLTIDGRLVLADARAVLILEEPVTITGRPAKMQKDFVSFVEHADLEEEGDLQVVIRLEGIHKSSADDAKIPFILRIKVGADSRQISFVHTFFYDGEEDKDYLKGLGIRFRVPMEGPVYNRHVKFEGDHGCFHESCAHLLSWIPRVPQPIYADQISGKKLELSGEELETVNHVMKAMPFWSEYDLCQDSPSHFGIRKKVYDANCCYLDCLHGEKTRGGAALGSEAGSVLFTLRDFRETYPSGYTFKDLDQDMAEATVWIWSPTAAAMDFRHYANRGYNQTYYEGYDHKGATAYGVGCTSEFSLAFSDQMIPGDDEIHAFSHSVNHPARYIGDPEYYHQVGAFGRWSLPKQETQMERWLEEQLDQAVNFYIQEVEQRNWYGLFNYGDFMHTYDPQRHQWRYDMGGYAWDNTELVPTLWLWLMFMRTGREDVYTLAEKLSRHTSEVDVYHFGELKGLGSRHNVRHWGCPCKEARIAMAAHHRFYYYLTGDLRMGEIFEEIKDNEMTFLNKDPLEAFYNKEEMVYPAHARSGPDWSSLCANWMTRWERFKDENYKKKIQTGIEDLKNAPLKLVSGPDFEFDPETTHLRYIGERAAGGTHLQICMGAPQVWFELGDLLGDEEWCRMLADYGRFYYLDRETQLLESNGLIGDREFSLPFMAAAMGAYGAEYLQDEKLARTTWCHLLHALMSHDNQNGFLVTQTKNSGNQSELQEIPWISTNFAAQWCLNVITVLDFIREYLPETLEDAAELVREMPAESFRKA